MEQSPKKRLINAFQGKTVDRIPCLSVTQTGTVELMEKTGLFWPFAHSDPEKMAALAYAGHEIAGLEAIRYPYCLTVFAEIMGCSIRMGTKEIQPSVLTNPFSNGPEDLKVPENLLEKGRIPTVLRATEILKTRTGNGTYDEIPLIAGMKEPLTVFSHIAGIKNCLIWTIKKPEYFDAFMETCTEICIEYANELFKYGVDVVCMPDGGIAGSRMMHPSVLENSVKPLYKRFCKKVKGPKVLHICGDVGDSLKTLSECGFDAISIEEKVSIKAAKASIGEKTRIIGNVSPSRTLLFGTPDTVKAEAKKCLSEGVDILAPGCGIAPRTPLANIRALVEARDEWYIEG